MLYHDTTSRLSAAERELLQALVDEATMGAVARRIGRSERHTRRLVRTLTHRLGVDHPRAVVALAGQMGWVDVAPGHSPPLEISEGDREGSSGS